MTQTLLHQILDYANRADPYPVYEELRKTPVHHGTDGPYVISTSYEIRSLPRDPRISSDARNLASGSADPLAEPAPEESALPPSFLRLDPPEHDRMRRMTNRHFGPPHSPHRVDETRPELQDIVAGLIDGLGDPGRIDLSCFGAPLARLEARLALSKLARRLENPRLLDDPPPYRQNAVLRGPRHLRIARDGIRPQGASCRSGRARCADLLFPAYAWRAPRGPSGRLRCSPP